MESNILLAIAIMSLIGIVSGIGYDLLATATEEPNPRLMLFSISIVAWWTLCLPLAIVLIVIGTIYLAAWLYVKSS